MSTRSFPRGERGARSCLGASVALLAWLGGCASVSPAPAHRQVDELVRDRTGHATRWTNGAPQDAEVERWLGEQLAHGLTRAAAIEIALVNNPHLQETYESLGVSQAEVVKAGQLRNPSFGAHVAFPVRGDGDEISFSLVQDFLDLFMLPLRKRIAEDQLAADVLHVAQAALDTTAEVEKALVAVQAEAALVEHRRSNAEATEGAVTLASAQRAAGNITELRLATVSAAHEQGALELAREELELLRQRERLNRLLGLWGAHADWQLAEPLGAPPAADLPLEHLESLAIRRRLDVDAARKRRDLLAKAVGLARRSRLVGRLDVGLDAHQDADGPRVLGPNLVIELPIFDQRQAMIAGLEAQQRQAERHLAALSVDARSEVRLARAEVVAARRIVDRYRAAILPLHEQALQEGELHYNGMQLGLYQLVELKQAQIAAQVESTAALRDYWTARADLDRAVGGRVELARDVAPKGAP